jgi:hypothetical protein
LPLPGGVNVLVGYPLLPWLGIVAAGYGFGEVIRLEPERRQRVMGITGVVMIAAFVILRAWGVSGDPRAWTTQATPLLTGLSFVNCTKQPPSPLFVLMTLGPAIAALAVIDRVGIRGPIGRALVTFGRVPLFYYLLQWYARRLCRLGCGAGRPLHPVPMVRGSQSTPSQRLAVLSLIGVCSPGVVTSCVRSDTTHPELDRLSRRAERCSGRCDLPRISSRRGFRESA